MQVITRAHEVRTGSAISSGAAVCLLLFFFLPWFSACDTRLDGAALATGAGGMGMSVPVLFGIPLIGVGVAVIGFRNLLQPPSVAARWARYILAMSAYPVFALVWLYTSIQNSLATNFVDLRPLVQVEFGFYGTLLATIGIAVGAVIDWVRGREADAPSQPQPATSSRSTSGSSGRSLPAPGRPRAWLQGQSGSYQKAMELVEEETCIGSASGCDIRISVPDRPGVCATVRYTPRGYYLQVQASTSSVRINGHPVVASALEDGDTIAIGATEITFRQL